MMSYRFTYKGNVYSCTVDDTPTLDKLEVLFQNAIETFKEIEQAE